MLSCAALQKVLYKVTFPMRPAKAAHMCSGTLSKDRQRQGSPTEKGSLHFGLGSESQSILGDCYLNSKALQCSMMFIKAILRSLFCASAILLCSGLAVVGLLGSSGDTLPWLLLILLLHWSLGIRVCHATVGAHIWSCICWVGVLFLSSCYPLGFLGDCPGCMCYSVGDTFVILPGVAPVSSGLNVFLGIEN